MIEKESDRKEKRYIGIGSTFEKGFGCLNKEFFPVRDEYPIVKDKFGLER